MSCNLCYIFYTQVDTDWGHFDLGQDEFNHKENQEKKQRPFDQIGHDEQRRADSRAQHEEAKRQEQEQRRADRRAQRDERRVDFRVQPVVWSAADHAQQQVAIPTDREAKQDRNCSAIAAVLQHYFSNGMSSVHNGNAILLYPVQIYVKIFSPALRTLYPCVLQERKCVLMAASLHGRTKITSLCTSLHLLHMQFTTTAAGRSCLKGGWTRTR